MSSLRGQVALVTGASRGVGRGIAASLAEAGATVYVTGRSVAEARLPPAVRRITCDHSLDEAVAGVFQRIGAEQGRLDILVNNAWAGYERMVEDGRFTWPLRFWEQPLWRWEAMVGIGARGAFVASQQAARLMVPAGRGLIVNLSYWAAQKHVGNVIYGVAKAATDKLTKDARAKRAGARGGCSGQGASSAGRRRPCPDPSDPARCLNRGCTFAHEAGRQRAAIDRPMSRTSKLRIAARTVEHE